MHIVTSEHGWCVGESLEAMGRAQLGWAKDLTHKGRCMSRLLLVGEGQTGNGPKAKQTERGVMPHLQVAG